ncbi:hypothetical protein ACFQ21_05250 [Ohtaekwangia kribbensis]|jgi:hypothetical protein|uniref:Lipoprotein n=1 Tax=Ohtaekwangia kribbensis TaxID=688913 RepID=A0ABW3JZT8_9BACT
MKYIKLIIPLIFIACSSTSKIYNNKAGRVHTFIRKGYFSGITYLVIDKHDSINEGLKLHFDCECDNWKQGLSKEFKSYYWKAVTDTIQVCKFYDYELSGSLTKPMQFLPITREESLLLEKAISLSAESCCNNANKPVGKIIGFVRTDIKVKN